MSQPFNSPLGNRAYTTDRVSHVQAASCSWWKQRLGELAKRVETSAAEYREAVKQFKDSVVWEDEYDTWEEAAQECLGITPQRANQLARELLKYIGPQDANFLMDPQKPDPVEKTVFKNLGKTGSETGSDSKVSETPLSTKSTLLPPKTADEWEKKEQFSAKPEAAIVPRAKPTENAKPLHAMALWTKVYEGYGALQRDVDGLNHIYHDEPMHARLLDLTKRAMGLVKEWQAKAR